MFILLDTVTKGRLLSNFYLVSMPLSQEVLTFILHYSLICHVILQFSIFFTPYALHRPHFFLSPLILFLRMLLLSNRLHILPRSTANLASFLQKLQFGSIYYFPVHSLWKLVFQNFRLTCCKNQVLDIFIYVPSSTVALI